MDRRKVLLLVAAVIAALGTLLVFLYVNAADNRADRRYDAVTVLKAVKQIEPGETAEAAQAAGKIETASVSRQDVLAGAINGLDPIAGKMSMSTIYKGEQIVSTKFGAAGSAAATSALNIPKGKIAISISLDDPARVAGFVNPGNKVAIFYTGNAQTRMLLPSVEVIAAGTTTLTPTTTTTATNGTQTVEQLPKTLLTLAVSQKDAEKVIFANKNGALSFALLNDDSQVGPSQGINTASLFK
jgi:pilus assembly protein CpaB